MQLRLPFPSFFFVPTSCFVFIVTHICVFIQTFENPNAYLFRPSYLVDRYWTSVEVDPDNTTGNGTGPRTYLTGPILETFMVVIALITMVFVGMCNLCKLQTPETYEVPKPQIKM